MRARRLLATVALAVGALLMSGCAAPVERPPVFDLLSSPQQASDRLPGQPTLWQPVLSGTTRLLGEVEGYAFYLGLSRSIVDGPYCLVVTDVTGAMVVFHCGNDTFTADVEGHVGFMFSPEPQEVSNGLGWVQLNPHLQVSRPTYRLGMPLPAIFDREQQVWDLLADDSPSRDSVVPESTRVLGEYMGYRFFAARSSHSDVHFCVILTYVDGQEISSMCGGGILGWEGGPGEPLFEFSPAGFPPDISRPGWFLLGDHLFLEDPFAKP
jgi:hypothetical protein